MAVKEKATRNSEILGRGEGEEGEGGPWGIGAGCDGRWRDRWRFGVGGQLSEEVEGWWVVAVVFWHC